MSIIPAINAATFDEAKVQLEKILTFLPENNLIHLDIVDGVFAPNITWGSPESLGELIANRKSQIVHFELHLMVQNPEAMIDAWLRTGVVKRVIVHLEAMTDSVYILEKCKRFGVQAMLAINPATDAERLLVHKDDFSFMQILAVYPGLAGQKFQPQILEKIRFLKQNAPHGIIEVDGGMNPEVAKQCKDAGAELFVSASYVVNNPNPERAFKELTASVM